MIWLSSRRVRSGSVIAMPAPRARLIQVTSFLYTAFGEIEPLPRVRHEIPRKENSFSDIPCISSSLQFYDDASRILACVRGGYSVATSINLNQRFHIPKIRSIMFWREVWRRLYSSWGVEDLFNVKYQRCIAEGLMTGIFKGALWQLIANNNCMTTKNH